MLQADAGPPLLAEPDADHPLRDLVFDSDMIGSVRRIDDEDALLDLLFASPVVGSPPSARLLGDPIESSFPSQSRGSGGPARPGRLVSPASASAPGGLSLAAHSRFADRMGLATSRNLNDRASHVASTLESRGRTRLLSVSRVKRLRIVPSVTRERRSIPTRSSRVADGGTASHQLALPSDSCLDAGDSETDRGGQRGPVLHSSLEKSSDAVMVPLPGSIAAHPTATPPAAAPLRRGIAQGTGDLVSLQSHVGGARRGPPLRRVGPTQLAAHPQSDGAPPSLRSFNSAHKTVDATTGAQPTLGVADKLRQRPQAWAVQQVVQRPAQPHGATGGRALHAQMLPSDRPTASTTALRSPHAAGPTAVPDAHLHPALIATSTAFPNPRGRVSHELNEADDATWADVLLAVNGLDAGTVDPAAASAVETDAERPVLRGSYQAAQVVAASGDVDRTRRISAQAVALPASAVPDYAAKLTDYDDIDDLLDALQYF